MCHECLVPMEARRGGQSPKAGAIVGYKPSEMGAGKQTWVLQNSSMYLTVGGDCTFISWLLSPE